MTLAVYFKSTLEPEIVDEDFHGALNVFNQTAARGMAFTVMDCPDGTKVMVHVPSITKVKELAD